MVATQEATITRIVEEGRTVGNNASYQYQRLQLGSLFAILVVVVGHWWGVRSLVSLAISPGVIFVKLKNIPKAEAHVR